MKLHYRKFTDKQSGNKKICQEEAKQNYGTRGVQLCGECHSKIKATYLILRQEYASRAAKLPYTTDGTSRNG